MSSQNRLLIPNFESIPAYLKAIPRWVLWRTIKDHRKIPFSAETNQSVDITRIEYLSGFDRVSRVYEKSRSYSGVGFVFSGDGLVGIDIDDCVLNGIPTEAALKLLSDLDCQYVEYSPSGTGLHGIGLYDVVFSGVRGTLRGLKVEIYSNRRYFTVTGHRCSMYEQAGDIGYLSGMSDLIDTLSNSDYRRSFVNASQESQESEESQEPQESHYVKETESIDDCSFVCKGTFPESVLPGGYGDRNDRIFKLARYLKGRYPDETFEDHIPRVRAWFDDNIDKIQTKDFGVTLADFRYAFDKIRVGYGEKLKDALANQPELPEWLRGQRYGESAERLLQICYALDRYHAPEPFFLSQRIAQDLIDLHHTQCGRLLRALVLDGYLERVEPGTMHKAAVYRVSRPDSSGH